MAAVLSALPDLAGPPSEEVLSEGPTAQSTTAPQTEIPPPISADALGTKLAEVAETAPDLGTFALDTLRILTAVTNAAGAAWVVEGPEGPTLAAKLFSRQAIDWCPNLEHDLAHAVAGLGDAGGERPLRADQDYVACAAGLTLHDSVTGEPIRCWLALTLVKSAIPMDAFYLLLQLASGYFRLFTRTRQAYALATSHKYEQALCDMAGVIERSESRSLAERRLAEGLRQLIGDGCVLIGRAATEGARLRVTSMTGVQELGRGAELTHEAEAAFAEPPLEHSSVPSAARERLRRTMGVDQLAFVGGDTTHPDIIVALGSKKLPTELIQAIARYLPLLRTALKVPPLKQEHARSASWRVLAAVACVALLAAMFVPVPHSVDGEVIVEPEARRFVAAPFDGVIKHSPYRAGDLVKKGELLAALDGREKRSELARLSADRERLHQAYSSALARGNAAEAEMNRLKRAAIDERIGLIRNQVGQLEIRAPIDGIILGGELDRVEGVPVKQGDRLFEVAAVNGLRAEIAIEDQNIASVSNGAPTELWLPSLGGDKRSGVVDRIRPQAEIRDSLNVFIIEVPLAGDDWIQAGLRPGARGEASIDVGDRALGWILFHRPWWNLRRWLGL